MSYYFFLDFMFTSIYFCVLGNETQYVDVLSDEDDELVLLNDEELDTCQNI